MNIILLKVNCFFLRQLDCIDWVNSSLIYQEGYLIWVSIYHLLRVIRTYFVWVKSSFLHQDIISFGSTVLCCSKRIILFGKT